MTTPLPLCSCSDGHLSHDCLRHGWLGVRESRGPKRTRLRAQSVKHQLEEAKWAAIKETLLLLGYRCVVCGSADNLDLDHIVPRARGGKSEARNAQLLCRRHHAAKHGVPMWSANE